MLDYRSTYTFWSSECLCFLIWICFPSCTDAFQHFVRLHGVRFAIRRNWQNILRVCEADLSMEGGGETEICVRYSEVTRSCRVWPMSRSWATVQLLSMEPSSSSASACSSSCWICCSRRRLRSFSSVSLCCSSAISSCTGFRSLIYDPCVIHLF